MLVAGAWHEWETHFPKLLAVESLTDAHLAVVKEPRLSCPGPLNARQWAALLYTEHMSQAVAVPDNVFQNKRDAGFDSKEVVELTVLIGAYNMVGQVFVALDVA